MNNYLGELVPIHNDWISRIPVSMEIKNIVMYHNTHSLHLYVTSKNNLKMDAAKNAINVWIKELFKNSANWMVEVHGIEVQSEIDEQPHGLENTLRGAQNRLKNMKAELHKSSVNLKENDNIIRVLVSMENGLCVEKLTNIKNRDIFELYDGNVWVDRCLIDGEIWYGGQMWNIGGISEGVTTPKSEVQLSESTNWTKTAGSFIAEKYKLNAKDWHGGMAGKGRQVIMKEAIERALGLPFKLSVPEKKSVFKPDVYHLYKTESIDFFVPEEITVMLEAEKKPSELISEQEKENTMIWRGIYGNIPQPNKPGADGRNPSNSIGVILTEDLLVGYFDEIDGQDVLHIVLLFSDMTKSDDIKEEGWMLPGKRDRSYDKHKGDISVQDADYSLVEKEIGVDRKNIDHHIGLGYFDDRIREQRMKSSGFFSFVLLNEKPVFIPGKRIGVPLNVLIQLARREITIPRDPQIVNNYGLIRNHDSLLLNIFETTKFYHTMNKIKLNQVKYRELLRTNPNAKRPSLSEFDNGYDCEICSDLLVGAVVICPNGHSVCGTCRPKIVQTGKCPNCRANILQKTIPNIILEGIVQNQYPKRYAERYVELTNQQPMTWKNDPAFNGKYIQYI